MKFYYTKSLFCTFWCSRLQGKHLVRSASMHIWSIDRGVKCYMEAASGLRASVRHQDQHKRTRHRSQDSCTKTQKSWGCSPCNPWLRSCNPCDPCDPCNPCDPCDPCDPCGSVRIRVIRAIRVIRVIRANAANQIFLSKCGDIMRR